MTTEAEPVRRPARGRRSGLILAAVLLITGILLFWSAVSAADGDYSLVGPRLAPVIVTAAWVLVAAAYLAQQFMPQQAEDADEEQEKTNWLAPAGVVAALVGFAVALEYAGFVVSAAVFIVVVSRVLGSRNLVRDAIVAVVLPVTVYLVFTRLLDIFLPAGVFPL